MRANELESALRAYVETASAHLQAVIAAGGEVPFELEQHARRRGSAGPGLFCYRPLTAEFISEHEPELERLPGYSDAAMLMADFEGLDRYVAGAGAELARSHGRAGARIAIGAILREVFDEQTDFEIRPGRLDAALERIERSSVQRPSEATLLATLHGLTITSQELQLTHGLTISRPEAVDGLPVALLPEGDGAQSSELIVVLTAEDDDPREALPRAREVLKDLLRALRLLGDGRVTLGALAWARIGSGPWSPIALGAGGRPHGMLIVSAEQEDELRGFCNLVSRRAPHGNELAWALRRFELGCERASAYEALSDHLLALRALLEPEGPQSGLLAPRLAALCATRERWAQMTERTLQALALERSVLAGTAIEHAGAQLLAEDMADSLRVLLRDVVCGHLDPDLVTIADEILREPEQAGPVPEEPIAEPELITQAPTQLEDDPRQPRSADPQFSFEEIFGDAGKAEQILDVFI